MQHFLLSPKSRKLSIPQIASMSERQAYEELKKIRFAENKGKPFCPNCGSTRLTSIPSRKSWRCRERGCRTTFSVISHTIFKDKKLPSKTILLAIAFFVNEPKGLSAVKLSHLLGVSYKTAFVLLGKLREVLTHHQLSERLSGEVEIDGGYFGGYMKPSNDRPARRDRRKLHRNKAKQQCVVIARERHGRSRAQVASEIEAADNLRNVVEDDSIIFTDKFSGSTRITANFKHYRVNCPPSAPMAQI